MPILTANVRKKAENLKLEARNVSSIVCGNASCWTDGYESGYWDFLRGRSQRPRHYLIAGLIRDLAPKCPRILEVGCGHALILGLLNGTEFTYLGLDISSEIIQRNRENNSNPTASFGRTDLNREAIRGKFDVIIASEVLYYFPLRRIPKMVRNFIDCLNPEGILILTMNKNPKSWLIWILVNANAVRRERLTCENARGSRWTVCVYQPKFPRTNLKEKQ